MMGVALIGLLMAIGNIYFAATQAMKVGKNLRAQIYQRVFRFSEREMSELGTSSLITRSTNDVVQIQNVIIQMLRMMIQSPIMLVSERTKTDQDFSDQSADLSSSHYYHHIDGHAFV